MDHDTAVKINHDSYVDDNLSVGAQVKLMNQKLSRSEERGFINDETVSKILSKVGMTPKVIVTSGPGEDCQEAIDKLREKILGQIWETSQMAEIKEVKGMTLVDKFYHISGKINIADIATRTGDKLEDIAPDS